MTDNFKEIGSLFGREGAGAGFVKQTDKESFTYAFAWPEGDTWATLTGYLNLDEQPVEDFALQCYQSVRQLRYADYTVIVSSLTSRLIDFKYLREAEAPAYTHGVSNDTFDYEFDDDDDDIPAFSFPEA